MLFRPAHSYPSTYRESSSEVEFVCDCDDHQGRMICGSARRTGLTLVEDWPVYELHSFAHREYNEILVALSPSGFVLRPVYTIKEQAGPNRTPFIASVLEDSRVPYDFDPHPVAWWMFTKGDLVQAVNKQVSGIRYVEPERFQACCTLVGEPSAPMALQDCYSSDLPAEREEKAQSGQHPSPFFPSIKKGELEDSCATTSQE